MSSLELENRQTIHEDILPRIKLLEDEQKAINIEMKAFANQMKAMELSNNDIKQTVVGYGQTHSMLLTKAMESMVSINSQNAQIVREVQTTKDKVDGQTKQIEKQSESEFKLANLGAKEKVILAVLTIPGLFSYIPKAYTFIINLFK